MHSPEAKGEFRNYLASRALIERVMREQLLATHANVDLRWGSPAAGLMHGSGADKGTVTGAMDAAADDADIDADGRVCDKM